MNQLPDGPAEFPILPELAIEPRRRDLEVVASRNESGGIEHIAGLAADALAVPDPDAAFLVDVQTQGKPAPFAAPFGVDQIEPVARKHGSDHVFDSRESLRVVHRLVRTAATAAAAICQTTVSDN